MSYTINRVITGSDFDQVDERTRQALTDHGFGVLTEIDVKATMKKKLDKDMSAIDNDTLKNVAGQVRDMLAKVVQAV